MRQKLLLLFCLCFVIFANSSFAQKRQINGTVKDEKGAPLTSASVTINGTKLGTITDDGGHFSIAASSEDVLVITALNYQSLQVTVGEQNNIEVVLKPGNISELNDVVVTALGIKREKRTLGYATQEVKGDDLTQTTQNNVLNSLSGRAAGVQITAASGAVGAGSRIVLRGNNSFGNNQPLIVVDGVPISNAATNVGAYGSVDYGSGVQDIDPNDIASINVLKGANAAALYGYRAGNGVILITTKSGKSSGNRGIGVSYTGGISFENPYILPKYQNKYGQGSNGGEYVWKRDHPDMTYQEYAEMYGFKYVDGAGNGVNDNTDESWGPHLDIGLMIPQYNSPVDADGNRTATPWISHPDNVKNYFATGHTIDNHISISTNSDKGSTRFSMGHQKQTGTIPNTDQTKYNFSINSIQNLTSRLTAEGVINYVHIHNGNLIGQGYNSYNPMQSIGNWFGRQVDMKDLKANYKKVNDDGSLYNWNSSYHNNPYAEVYSVFNNARQKDRMFGYMSLSYEFSKWFNLKARAGDDWSTEFRKEISTSQELNNWLAGINGTFIQREYHLNELNLDLLASGGDQIGSSDFSIHYNAGANYRDYTQKNSTIGAGDLTVPNLFTIANAKGSTTQTMYDYHLRSNSIFGQASIGYKNWLNLDLSARNDWNSSLPAASRSFFYPSASLSWIFSDALGINHGILNYGKLRASWAKVGNATDPYQVFPTYTPITYTFNGVSMYRYPASLPALVLEPEMAKSIEAGLELQFFQNRIGLDATYYDKKTSNQIMNVDISAAGGSSGLVVNAGEIENKGIGLQLHLGILRPTTPNGLSWDMDVNFAKNKNMVNKLYTDPNTGEKLESFNITGAWGITVDAIPGQAFGVIRGDKMVRDDNGNIVVDAEGLPTFESTQVLGNITPDWVGGVNNTFAYKNFHLGFLVDFRRGGDIYSVTDMFGGYTGVLAYTAEGNMREDGIILGKDYMTDKKFVKEDGTPNDIRASASDVFKKLTYANAGGSEFDVFSGSYIKLRQIEFGYTFPKSSLSKVDWLKGASLSLFSYNVALLKTSKGNKAHIDPETGFGVGNDGLGIEQGQIPSNRSIGLKLKLNF
jgi:TonB-linked SusC/RagA family outer membrane protein